MGTILPHFQKMNNKILLASNDYPALQGGINLSKVPIDQLVKTI